MSTITKNTRAIAVAGAAGIFILGLTLWGTLGNEEGQQQILMPPGDQADLQDGNSAGRTPLAGNGAGREEIAGVEREAILLEIVDGISGDPIERAEVTWWTTLGEVRRGYTESNGNLALQAPGRYALGVECSPYIPIQGVIPIESNVRIQLHQTTPVRVEVCTAPGGPLQDTPVWIIPEPIGKQWKEWLSRFSVQASASLGGRSWKTWMESEDRGLLVEICRQGITLEGDLKRRIGHVLAIESLFRKGSLAALTDKKGRAGLEVPRSETPFRCAIDSPGLATTEPAHENNSRFYSRDSNVPVETVAPRNLSGAFSPALGNPVNVSFVVQDGCTIRGILGPQSNGRTTTRAVARVRTECSLMDETDKWFDAWEQERAAYVKEDSSFLLSQLIPGKKAFTATWREGVSFCQFSTILDLAPGQNMDLGVIEAGTGESLVGRVDIVDATTGETLPCTEGIAAILVTYAEESSAPFSPSADATPPYFETWKVTIGETFEVVGLDPGAYRFDTRIEGRPNTGRGDWTFPPVTSSTATLPSGELLRIEIPGTEAEEVVLEGDIGTWAKVRGVASVISLDGTTLIDDVALRFSRDRISDELTLSSHVKLPKGGYRLLCRVWGESNCLWADQVISIPVGGASDSVQVHFQPGAILSGVKTGVGRQPIRLGFESGPRVDMGVFRTTSDDQGRFELRGLPARTVLVDLDSGRILSLPGENQTLSIEL